MENIEWRNVSDNQYGIQSMAFKDIGLLYPNVGQIVGFNGILKGDLVKYKDKKYTVVMVSKFGDFGLSETGELPYILRVLPSDVQKIIK